MRYNDFGRTNARVSALGFGAMRLPMKGDTTVDRELAIPMLVRAYELGVNYFDTGKWYCAQDSERTLGEALRQMDRSQVFVSTKYAPETPSADDLRSKLEVSLKLLGVDYVDFYHFWGISWKSYAETLSEAGGPLEGLLRAKEEGLVRHASFSFHSEPEDIPRLVDTGVFETMLCQYNLLDRKNEAGMAYAAQKGLGVAVMGPVGGGRLGGPSEVLARLSPDRGLASSAELALRFVLTNPSVSLALSGMSTLAQLEQNVAVAGREDLLSPKERADVDKSSEENQQLMDLYCTGCNYCLPCPEAVNIPEIFRAMNHYRVWGLEEHARNHYRSIGRNPWLKGKQADACIECGECEAKCPQHIPVISQLQDCRRVLAGD